MRIIDFHAHIYPDKIAEKATNATGGFYGITPACLGTSEALLREGKSVTEVQEALAFSGYAHFFKTFQKTTA